MKIELGTKLIDLRPYEINREFDRIKNIINGKLSFGNLRGDDRNMDGELIYVSFPLVATDVAINHSLKTLPTGYLILRNFNGSIIYDGLTPWNHSTIYLRSNLAASAALVFILR